MPIGAVVSISWPFLLLITVARSSSKFNTPLIIEKSASNVTDENQRLCGTNGRLLKVGDNLPISCAIDKDCLGKGRCEPTSLLCCVPLLAYDPADFELCPKGFHSLKASSKRPLVCQLNQPNQCPNNAKCMENKKLIGENRWQCCKEDPGEVCGSDRRALKPCDPSSNHIECPQESRCIRSTSTQQFVCCVDEVIKAVGLSKLSALKQVAVRQTGYTCPRRFLGPEIEYNRERRCNSYGEYGQCGLGFTCVNSNEDPNVLLCCGPASPINDSPLYRCAALGSIAEEDFQGRNVFCDLINQQTQCARGSTCQAAVNSYGMMICCRSAPTTVPLCPEDRAAQPADAGYMPCDTGRPQCQNGYICLPSLNQPQIALCCSRFTSQALICPDQQVLFRESGRVRICSPTQINPCPSGYTCRASVLSPTIYICCSGPSTATCPAGYAPQLDFSGNPLYCSIQEPNICPGGSQCLESQNQPNIRTCCRSTTSPRVCPEDLDALLRPGTNQLERCNNPGGACSQAAYTCRYSDILAGYVCCGRPTPVARCADGRETYVQDFGRTYTCIPTRLGTCPNNYDCAPSSLNGLSVCCRTPDVITTTIPPNEPTDFPTFRPPVPELTCPVGWSAYEDGMGAHHFCRSALDSFSCVQSSVNGIFLCCRLASNLRCQNTLATPLLQNNAPRLCTARYINSCPQGFTCQQSTIAQVHICCSLTNSLVPVINGQTPYSINNNFPVINGQTPYSINSNGPVINGQTPYTINNNFPIVNGQTPYTINSNGPVINGQTPYTINNPSQPPWNLNGPTINGQLPPGWSSAPTSNELLCSDGEIPAYRDNRLLQCNWLGQADICPPTYWCALSNRQGVNVCCHYLLRSRYPLHQHNGKVLNQNVCGKTAIAYMNNRLEPLECSKEPDICPKNFDCQPSLTDNLMYCCQEAKCRSQPNQLVRVHKTCQEDTDCKGDEQERCEHSVNIQFIRICCPTSATINSVRPTVVTIPAPPVVSIKTLPSILSSEERTRCVGRRTLLIRNEAVQCKSDDACPDDFVCSSLTSNGEPICCERAASLELVCPENRDPLRHVSSDQLAFCDPYDSEAACPAGYLCKWSTQKFKHVCCTPVAFCERGRVPLIDERTQQAKRCFERSSATGISEQCDAGFACSESTVPRLRLCCSVVGSAFVVAQAANAVERSLGDDKLWTVIEG